MEGKKRIRRRNIVITTKQKVLNIRSELAGWGRTSPSLLALPQKKKNKHRFPLDRSPDSGSKAYNYKDGKGLEVLALRLLALTSKHLKTGDVSEGFDMTLSTWACFRPSRIPSREASEGGTFSARSSSRQSLNCSIRSVQRR